MPFRRGIHAPFNRKTGRKVIEGLSSRLEGKRHYSYYDNYFSSVAGFQRDSLSSYTCVVP